MGELRKIVGNRPLLSAGATVLVIQNGTVLLNLRSDTKTWGIPGGGMELGESLEETAHRELFEETSLRAEKMELLTVLSGKDFYFVYPNGDELYSVVALYQAIHVSGELNIADGESLELAYFPFDNLPPLESRAEAVLRWYQEAILSC